MTRAATVQRREELRARIVEAARRTVVEGGVEALRARDLARDAGCALGALYNAVGDRNAILAALNGETFAALGAFVGGRVAAEAGPLPRMIAMAHAYRAFAQEHPRLWAALFDQALRQDDEVAEGYLSELTAVIGLIEAEVAALHPGLPLEEVGSLARLLFSAVHGTVMLSLEGRLVAVPEAWVDEMLARLVRDVASGSVAP